MNPVTERRSKLFEEHPDNDEGQEICGVEGKQRIFFELFKEIQPFSTEGESARRRRGVAAPLKERQAVSSGSTQAAVLRKRDAKRAAKAR